MSSCIQFVIIFDVFINFRPFTFSLSDYEYLGTFQLYIIIILYNTCHTMTIFLCLPLKCVVLTALRVLYGKRLMIHTKGLISSRESNDTRYN